MVRLRYGTSTSGVSVLLLVTIQLTLFLVTVMSGVVITTMNFSLRKEFTIELYISLVIHAMNTTHQLHMYSTSMVFQ